MKMASRWTLFLVAGLSATAPVEASDLRPAVVGDLTGNMHVSQTTPRGCGGIETDVPVIGGRFELAPAEGREVGNGDKMFLMTYGVVSFRPFTVSACGQRRIYSALSVQVANAVSFRASPAGGGRYAFRIPAEDVLLHEAAIANGASEVGNKHPMLPVSGTIDLVNATLEMTVVVASKVHVDFLPDMDGTLTTTLSGTIRFP